jgi:hypothetical protein
LTQVHLNFPRNVFFTVAEDIFIQEERDTAVQGPPYLVLELEFHVRPHEYATPDYRQPFMSPV